MHQDVTWPDPEMVEFPVLKEILPVYSGWLEIQGTLFIQVPAAGRRIDSVGVLTFSGVQSTRMRASANRYLLCRSRFNLF